MKVSVVIITVDVTASEVAQTKVDPMVLVSDIYEVDYWDYPKAKL